MKIRKVLLASLAAFFGVAFSSAPVFAAFPGQNGKIAYSAVDGEFNASLKDVNMNGNGARVLATSPIFMAPRYSADGKKLVATGYSSIEDPNDTAGNIYIMNADGSSPQNLTNYVDEDIDDGGRSASFSSFNNNGDSITFSEHWRNESDEFISRVYKMNADGSNKQELTTTATGACDFYPVYSPDGSKIAFVRNQGGGNPVDLYVMNADGSDQHQVTEISPNGNVCSASESLRNIWFGPSQFMGSRMTTIDWSPDGSKLVYGETTGSLTGSVATNTGYIKTTDLSGQTETVYERSASWDEAQVDNEPDDPPEDVVMPSLVSPQFTPEGDVIFKNITFKMGFEYDGSEWQENEDTMRVQSSLQYINPETSAITDIEVLPEVDVEGVFLQIYGYVLPAVQPVGASAAVPGSNENLAETGQSVAALIIIAMLLFGFASIGFMRRITDNKRIY